MKEVELIPEVRFNDFLDKKCSEGALSEICIINPNNKELPDKFFYIDLESVNSGKLEKINEINKSEAPSRAQRLLNKGDILYQTVRPYQKNNLYFDMDGFFVASTGYAQIRSKIDSQFLYQYLHTTKFVNKVLKRCTGTSYPAINSNDLKTLSIVIPSEAEQQKIASFLTAVDKRIQLLSQKKEKLGEYKKGVMQKIFSQELRFKDGNGNNYSDWEEKKLGEVGETFNGLTGKTKVDFGEGQPYIQYKQIFDNSKIDIKRFDYVKIDKGENQNQVQFGDVFFTTSSETPNEIGMSSVLLNEVKEAYLNSFCFGFRPNSTDELVPAYARFFFRSDLARKEIIKLAQGSTRFNMSKVGLMKLSYKFPYKEEQQKIANFLSALDKQIEQVAGQVEKLKEWKKGLLQKMFV